MRPMAMTMVFGLWLAAMSASPLRANTTASVIHRCVGARGDVSYQSAPCAAGTRLDGVRAIVARPSASASGASPKPRGGRTMPASAPARAGPASASRRSIPEARARGAARPDATSRRHCETARREAAATRDRLWNRLGFRERSELDAHVARACAR